jgi:hypothetical protein
MKSAVRRSSDLEQARAIAGRLVGARRGLAVEKPRVVSFRRGARRPPHPGRPLRSRRRPPQPAPARPARRPPSAAARRGPGRPFSAESSGAARSRPSRRRGPPSPAAPGAGATPARPLQPPPPPLLRRRAKASASRWTTARVSRQRKASGDRRTRPAEEAVPPTPGRSFLGSTGHRRRGGRGGSDRGRGRCRAAPTWAQILDDHLPGARRCALVMDAAGQVHESRGNWPPTPRQGGGPPLRGIEQAGAPPSPTPPSRGDQLGLPHRRPGRLQGSPVVVAVLSQAPVKREARPGLEAEIKRGMALSSWSSRRATELSGELPGRASVHTKSPPVEPTPCLAEADRSLPWRSSTRRAASPVVFTTRRLHEPVPAGLRWSSRRASTRDRSSAGGQRARAAPRTSRPAARSRDAGPGEVGHGTRPR